MPVGTFRRVIPLGKFAIKIPRIRNLISGMRSNRWEREMWRIWRPKFRWKNLCPIMFADPLGLVVVMVRARQPVTPDQVYAAIPNDYPDIDCYDKAENFRRLDGRIVAIDYGLWDAAAVRKRRLYLAKAPVIR